MKLLVRRETLLKEENEFDFFGPLSEAWRGKLVFGVWQIHWSAGENPCLPRTLLSLTLQSSVILSDASPPSFPLSLYAKLWLLHLAVTFQNLLLVKADLLSVVSKWNEAQPACDSWFKALLEIINLLWLCSEVSQKPHQSCFSFLPWCYQEPQRAFHHSKEMASSPFGNTEEVSVGAVN